MPGKGNKRALRRCLGIWLLLVTGLGFGCKFYPGPGSWWLNNYGAGVFYEVFWVLVFLVFFPERRWLTHATVWVFVATSALECMQLWHPWFLEKVRSRFLGQALIGTTFSWWDFPHYAAGCLAGWVLARRILAKGAVVSCAATNRAFYALTLPLSQRAKGM